MNRDSSFSKSLREDTQKSEKKYKAFRDISKYFSKKEWAKLSHSEKITYVYLKRNYTTMTSLGLRATLPAFMSSNGQITESQSDDSDEYRNRGSQDESPESASGILQRKRQKMPKKPAREENDPKGVPEAVGSEQAQRQLYPLGKASTSGNQSEKVSGPRKKSVSIWSHRLRERKYLVAYEEISDPEEDD
ncbi:protein SSX1-like [Sciurus carolinensis]|uniref:protein SSX1-like n=1 Tax=Sciurus carolinensis TaxID=30640 RepID=UPI001FB4343E|nr:protein SSX1-like [Sciurus carolinensis]